MKPNAPCQAFTLVELLLVIAVLGLLAALLLPALGAAKARAQRTTCLNNLRQINLGVRMYCDESNDTAPDTKNNLAITNVPWVGYKELMKNYVGLHGASSPQDKIFACPADRFYYDWKRGYVPQPHHDQAAFDYSSYALNALNLRSNAPGPWTAGESWPGIGGRRLSSIKDPSRTLLVTESPAAFPYSWHDPKPVPPRSSTPNWNPGYNNARDVVSFVDGHVSYTLMYWDPSIICCIFRDPPAGYDYKWSGN